jgi:hypothetical protein
MRMTKHIRITAVLLALVAGAAFAQAQGRGGRGGPAVTPLNPAQTAALGTMQIPAELQQAVTEASSALVGASLATPRNDADIRAKAAALSAAELALANARADAIAGVQDLLRPLSAEQAVAFAGRAGGGGRGGNIQPDSYEGFTSLFNGRDLTGWNGDPMFWSVQNGVIVAESTTERVVGQNFPGNTFLIWEGGNVKDFELKVDYRFATGGGNSGVQFRSRMADVETRPWGISGYQMDMVAAGGTGSGVVYTEGGGFGLLPQASAVRATADGTRMIGNLGTAASDAINASPEWNTYHIIARQNVIAAFVNGRMTAFLVDENRTGAQFAQEGLLALQMHVGAPFRLEFRNVYLKNIGEDDLTKLPTAAPAGRGGRGGQ